MIREVLDGRITIDFNTKHIVVNEPLFARQIRSEITDVFDEPDNHIHSEPLQTRLGLHGPWFDLKAINGWTLLGKDLIDYRAHVDPNEKPNPGGVTCEIIYKNIDGTEHSRDKIDMIPRSFVTYFVDNKGVRQYFVDDEEFEKHLSYDEDTWVHSYLDDDGELHEITSIDGEIALFEVMYSRAHHLYKGLLHKIDGPAFKCTEPRFNQEYHVFGIWLDSELVEPARFLNEHEAYLKQLEVYVLREQINPREVYTFSSFKAFRESAEGGYFQWSGDSRKVFIMGEQDLRRPIVEEEPSSAAVLALSIAAVSTVAALAISATSKQAQARVKSKKKVTQESKQAL